MATKLGDQSAAGGHVPLIVLILDPRRGSGLWVSRRECPGVCVLHENDFLGFLGEED